ncbi:MAG TPA: exodeoxyribonuclease VII large subunit [Geothermobacteraceae bacterium]|nr:exodeoxyribonuclease VII large subunit [Geothermobacteraceae bacterium]
MHSAAGQTILSVARLTALLQEVVEENFVDVLVEGEVSNLVRPASGHYYFTLKDCDAQLRAAMFRPQARALRFALENGLQVICRGRVSLYRQRGELQLIVEGVEPSGQGGLQLAFEQLKQRLAAEGLFAEEQKQPLPAFPRCIGVVTSSTGAAIRDILNILERRGSGLRILLAPVRVQGASAAAEIAAAIADMNRLGVADVLIVGRGGGSLEDLWAFNEEPVVRAIHRSKIPVVSAVGHETDFTLADLAADLRAPTPSAAAELVVKNRLELETHLDHLLVRLQRKANETLLLAREKHQGLLRRLRLPVELLQRQQDCCATLEKQLRLAMRHRLDSASAALALVSGKLQSLSPLETLARGYSIALDSSNAMISDAGQLRLGQSLCVRMAKGEAITEVKKVRKS